MKKMGKAMYGKTMMNDGGKVGRAERKEIRQGRRARTKELVDEGLITPFEGIKLRMQAAKEARQGQKKTGGMVNSNAKILVDKTPGSKGTKVGLNPKAGVTPKAKYGMSMKPGMMKKGGAKKK